MTRYHLNWLGSTPAVKHNLLFLPTQWSHTIHADMITGVGTPTFHSYSYDTIEGETTEQQNNNNNNNNNHNDNDNDNNKKNSQIGQIGNLVDTCHVKDIFHSKIYKSFTRLPSFWLGNSWLHKSFTRQRFDSQSRFMHPGFCKHRQGRICGNGILSKQRSMASPHRTNLLLAVVVISIMFYHMIIWDIITSIDYLYISMIIYLILSAKAIIKIENQKQWFEAPSVHTSEKNGINECQKKPTFPSLIIGGIESFPLLQNQNLTKHLSKYDPCKSPHISTEILMFRHFLFWWIHYICIICSIEGSPRWLRISTTRLTGSAFSHIIFNGANLINPIRTGHRVIHTSKTPKKKKRAKYYTTQRVSCGSEPKCCMKSS